ncbi:Cof-type HAD-IIB family hydrolase [Bacillus cereus group sp. TH152-1LC]|uniref:Cof-type HAD-IIB family hydrolase n=1 Tax=Bacillus cereus group sp. TH152-1LC TaxID=3018060 RepID=UPI0022E058AD|nr:Cof-type HAD-IIB family hydrolase [Bacillus cereus group sp. TH152-1LC]MDA1675260.1 Cof-type HAD-IIB family hydrolase [Bacillus cereus group sp. TH152-1LC]
MKYKIVFLDIDGTILSHNHTIPESTKKAVKELKEKGIEVVIATGRSSFETKHIADELGITSTITFNGSYVNYNGEEVYKQNLSEEIVSEFIQLANKKGDAVSCSGLETKYYTKKSHPVVQEAIDTFEFKGTILADNLEQLDGVFQMNLYCNTKDELNSYHDTISGLRLAPWNTTLNCADVLSSETSKAEGIKTLLSYLNISKEEAVAFGDGLNDIEMLSFVGAGVAMGNSHPKLFAHAKFKTTSVDKDGIYCGLKGLGIL